MPPDHDRLAAVATDDVIFLHSSRSQALADVAAYDVALERAHAPKPSHKDKTCEAEVVALGCELSNSPVRACPDRSRLLTIWRAVAQLLIGSTFSPKGCHSLLGLMQWFCILCRPMFAVFDQAYAFTRTLPDDKPVAVPQQCLFELVVFTILSGLLDADLERQWAPFLYATDASSEFGFGACVLPLSATEVGKLGLLSERRATSSVWIRPSSPVL